MSEQLTDKQEAVLAVIERHWRAHGVSPSVAEIAERLGLRKSTTHEHLMAIKRKGALVHVEGQSRSWRPTSVVSGQAERRIPIVGQVAAGAPLLAQENIDGWLTVSGVREGQTVFALHVRGDSMTGAGILDGDLVIVRQQPVAEDGDIVLALIDEQDATIKRLRRHGDRVTLQPENPAHEPLTLPADRVQLQGKVIGLRRDYS
ncbi:MAG TPA: transcriptional repressor LexA [Polyangiaceae bacterium LLY-WYZ-15_(1-7)]|jgi:repressor LexA|nr:repressor LexA [Sandaracinus sp.]MBJ74646.1 repressor LexA [Sandaracinus sp.]HJL07748.1 transcriptional repressor LexA [Polyangiaceae bacterium LLY-WYZ-15_(1-7)]